LKARDSAHLQGIGRRRIGDSAGADVSGGPGLPQ
jgi:hypothetical protein